MDKTENPGQRRRNNIFGESVKDCLAGASAVHHCGNTLVYPGNVGVNTHRQQAAGNVGMHVDNSGGNYIVLNVNHLLTRLRRNVFSHPADFIAGYGYVQLII